MHGNASAMSHLNAVLNSPSRERFLEDDAGLPAITDGHYQPHARPSNKPVYAIHFVTPSGDVRSFQYAHLDSGSRFTAEKITLAFMGIEPARVAIEGRNLWQLYDYVHQHRMPWILVAARDFAKEGDPIVTRIAFTPIKAEEI